MGESLSLLDFMEGILLDYAFIDAQMVLLTWRGPLNCEACAHVLLMNPNVMKYSLTFPNCLFEVRCANIALSRRGLE